jgi:hypothetical protein
MKDLFLGPRSPKACILIKCYDGAELFDKHLASTIHCVDDEINLSQLSESFEVSSLEATAPA